MKHYEGTYPQMENPGYTHGKHYKTMILFLYLSPYFYPLSLFIIDVLYMSL